MSARRSRLVAPGAPVVSFMGIGAPRSGTSWLARCIDEHPELSIPIKETHFFSRDENYRLGHAEYERRTTKARPDALRVGEFSANYLSHPEVPERIRRYNPDLRLIVILRNPVERAFSHFLFDVGRRQVSLDSSLSVAAERRPEYLAHGRYHEHLCRYLKTFSRASLLILIHEELRDDPAVALRRTFSFLGVASGFVPPSIRSRVNETRLPRSSTLEGLLDQVSRIFSRPPLRPIRRLLLNSGVPRFVRRLNGRFPPPRTLTQDERAWLQDVFSPDVDALRGLLGRSLPWSDFE